MHVYFVRHGETLLNIQRIHQSPNTPLSVKGRDESRTVGELLRSINPDLLLTSEYTRTKETARIVGQCVGLIPQTSGFFFEIERPSALYGKSILHPETIWYVILSLLHRANPTWRYKDAENFSDISARAQRALQFLESLAPDHESVIVVSHAIFINIMVAYLCERRRLSLSGLLLSIFHIVHLKNTEVVHVVFDQNAPPTTCAWTKVK